MSITLHINQGIRVFFPDFTCVCNAFLNALLDLIPSNYLVNYSILLLLYTEEKIFHNFFFQNQCVFLKLT